MPTDRARFEALFCRHYGAVMRYAARRVGVDAAGEVVSETFLVAWRRLEDVPDNGLPWLYATARRIVANEVRRRDRQLRLGERLANERPTPHGDDPAEMFNDSARVRSALDAVQWQSPGTPAGGFTVYPVRFPKDGTFVVTVDMAPAGTSSLSTFAPGQPQIEGFTASMVVGPIPKCSS